MREMTLTDALTGIANRRSFNEGFENEWRRCARSSTPLSVIMIDIDHFKLYNDAYGHQAGDACLQQVADTMLQCAGRSPDLLARYGGEEFVILLPQVDAAGAATVAERILASVRALAIPHRMSSAGDTVTVSLGVATLMPDQGADHEALVRCADNALYRAKKDGRNRFRVEDCGQG